MDKTTKNSRLPVYARNDSWNVVYENGLLLLNAGADRIFAIEGISQAAALEILSLWRQDDIVLKHLSTEAQEVAEQLKSAYILLNKTGSKERYRIALRFAGTPIDGLVEQAKTQLGDAFTINDARHDLLVIIRTNSRLVDLTTLDYGSTETPHLLVDVAFEHSISLGPLVFWGESACLSCLVGRLTTYWGDAEPPVQAAFQGNLGLIAGLVALEAKKILERGDRELVNNTVAYDFENHKVKRNSIYRLPMCPACSTTTLDSPGSITLPWLQ